MACESLAIAATEYVGTDRGLEILARFLESRQARGVGLRPVTAQRQAER